MKKSFDIYTPKERIINLLRWNDALGSMEWYVGEYAGILIGSVFAVLIGIIAGLRK